VRREWDYYALVPQHEELRYGPENHRRHHQSGSSSEQHMCASPKTIPARNMDGAIPVRSARVDPRTEKKKKVSIVGTSIPMVNTDRPMLDSENGTTFCADMSSANTSAPIPEATNHSRPKNIPNRTIFSVPLMPMKASGAWLERISDM